MNSSRADRIATSPAWIDTACNLSLCRWFDLKRTSAAHRRRRSARFSEWIKSMSEKREGELKPLAKGTSRGRTTEQRRHAQNISGMLRVLFGSIAPAVVGFATIYVFNQPPQTPAAASKPASIRP
jgi:hypothetical protein